VLVDLRNVTLGTVAPTSKWPATPVSRVDVNEDRAPDGAPRATVRLALSAPAAPTVRAERNLIRVEFPGTVPASSTAAGRRETSATATPAPGAGTTTTLTEAATHLVAVSAAAASGRTTVTLRGNGRLVPRAVEEAKDLPPRLLVDLPGVASSVPVVTPVDSESVSRIRVAANSVAPLVTRVVLDLKRRVPFAVEGRDDALVLVLGGTAGAENTTSAAAAPGAAATAVSPSVPPVARTLPPADVSGGTTRGTPSFAARSAETSTLLPPPAAATDSRAARPAPAAIETPEPATPAPAAAADASAGQTPPEPPRASALLPQSGQDRQFSGHPVTLDFQGVDLRAVLRTFSEITGLNIVIDPSVQGNVDVALREVPWDQALDIVLRANQLGYTVEGNIVRIAPLVKLREEQEEKRKLAEARALSGDLEMLTRTLSYAKAEDMIQLLTRAALTQRGSIQVDKRTNTLILRDLPAGLEASRKLVDDLDRPQPQVEIEARIVQTNRNFLRELGFRWNVGGEASQRLANALPLTYPNQVGVAGGTDLSTLNPASSVIGLVTSSVNGAINIDVELQAAEREGKVKVLSTPKVSTQNNVEAEISQGTQIPVQTVANNTVTVTFKDATLTLKVRPQITSSNTVIMNVMVENGSPDYTRQVNGIPPIDTQRANTQVQVNDGATTVIGGIFVSNERHTQDRTPGLHRIPLLGWLFKSDNRSDSSQELVIFLTPRIIKG
jgi:type IV pilus assembly protein PilQ